MGLSQIALGILYGLPIFLIGIAIGLASLGGPTDLEFWSQRILVIAAAVLGIAAISYLVWTSDGSTRAKIAFDGIAGMVIFAAMMAAVLWIDHREIVLTTKLYPSKDPTPSAPRCTPPANVIVVSLGSNIGWTNANRLSPLTIDGEPVAILEKENNGTMNIVSLKIYDDQGNAIVQKRELELIWVKPDLKTSRPDKSTLVVYDRAGVEAFRIRYANKLSLIISGQFLGRNGTLVNVTDHSVEWGRGNRASGNCAGFSIGGTLFTVTPAGGFGFGGPPP
jgi:hypothetical protein